MKVVEFLSHLNDLDITLWLEEEKLRYQAPKGVMTPEIKQAIGTRKSEISAFLKQAKTLSRSVERTIVPIPRNGKLPLSFAQQRLWFLHQLSPDSQSYNMLEALRLKGPLNVDALEQSLNELVRRHEILRTTFPMVSGEPVQVIAAPTALTLSIHNLQELSAEAQTAHIQQMAIAAASKPFNLAIGSLVQFTLLQLNSQANVLLLKMHHIIYDGWSLNIFFGELSQLYAAFSQGLPSPLPELPIQYADFAVWQRQWLTGDVLERQLHYWQEQLAGAPLVLELPSDRPRPPVQTFQGAVEHFVLDRDLTQRLKYLSQESETTLFMTLLAAFLVLMSRYSGQSDLVVGSPIANRNSKSIEQLIGFFANTLAFRGNLSGNPSFQDFLAQVRQTTLSAYNHQGLPFEMLVERLQPDRDLSRNPLIQVLFSLQNAPQSEGSLTGLAIQNIPLPVDVKARFDLEVNVWEVAAGLEGVWCYGSDLFDATTIARMGQQFQTLLTEIVASPQARISELPLLSPAERHQLLVEWNNTQTDYPHDRCIHQLFEAQVERTPDAIAVVHENQHLTYRELNNRANQLAHYLRSFGVEADRLVGLCVERSINMIVGVLGILKAGGAYVPLDPEYPTERLSFMLLDAQISVLLTQQSLLERLPDHTARLVCLDTDWHLIEQSSQDNAIALVQPNNLAYVIYTSGSTGQPKGVEVVHRGVSRLLFGVNYVQLDATQRFLQLAPISFDASTFEIWGALLHGARCVLFPRTTPTSQNLREEIHKHGITVLWLTAALFNSIIDDDSQALLEIKQLLIGGEALSVAHVQKALAALPFTQIINGYGPTENTTFTCCHPISRQIEATIESIPIGRAIANTQVYILDAYLQPVPVGVPGELHIGGAGLARGYLNQPKLTREKFIPNPFQSSEGDKENLSSDSKYLYKTGDLARYLPDGTIEFLGRIDNQVKIRGFRIELGEIEAVLSQHRDVQTSCVIAREDTPGEKRLVAYIVPQPEVILTTGNLRQFLANKLPSYMLPNTFVMLESLPLTPNGKVDRRALKAPSHSSEKDRFIEARSQLELKLVQIWSKILKVDKIGVQDNFFDLGGHSLLAPYLMAQIQQQLGKELPLTTLFQHPTIEQLAVILQSDSDDSGSSYLVAIQPNGSDLPFFCVPGVGGKPFYLYDLGRYLGSNQPFYSFQSTDQNGELEILTRIEDMASHYIQAVRSIQPQGPYFLGGHSFGGKVAFEMAQQLVGQGHEVALLVMIDIAAPSDKETPILMDCLGWDNAQWLGELVESAEIALARSLEIPDEVLQSLTVEEQFEWVLQHLKRVNFLPLVAETRHLKTMMEVYKTNTLSMIDYRPKQIYPAQITLLRASELPPIPPEDADDYLYFKIYSEISQDSTLGWSELSTKPMNVNFVPGSHFSMVTEPHVQVLAEQLKAYIGQAQSKLKLHS